MHYVLKFQIYGKTWTEWILSCYETLLMYGLIQPALHCVHHNSSCTPKFMSHDGFETLVYSAFFVHALLVLVPVYGQQLMQMQYIGLKYAQCKWVLVWNTLFIIILRASGAISLCVSTLVLAYVCVLVPLHFSNFFLAS